MSDLLSLNPPDGHPMSVADENRLQERLEELARDEVLTAQPLFLEFAADLASDLAVIAAYLLRGTQDACIEATLKAERIESDYIYWRTNDSQFIEDVQQLMAREDGEDE